MDESLFGLISIVLPLILVATLGWLAFRSRRRRPAERDDSLTARGTDAEYADEERRRREGTDGL